MSKRSLTQSRKTSPATDMVMTPPSLAQTIVNHFRPSGACLDPCCGEGAFGFAMMRLAPTTMYDIAPPKPNISKYDFIEDDWRYSWIITNPPWSKMRAFRRKAMQVSDNVVFLCSPPVWFYTATQKDLAEFGFGLVELLYVPMPPKPWPSSGLGLAAGWIRRGWTGACHVNRSLMPGG